MIEYGFSVSDTPGVRAWVGTLEPASPVTSGYKEETQIIEVTSLRHLKKWQSRKQKNEEAGTVPTFSFDLESILHHYSPSHSGKT